MHIGEKIREEVRRQELTNEEFAELICVNRRTVNKLYSKQSIDVYRLYQISKVLNVDFFRLYSELLNESKQ